MEFKPNNICKKIVILVYTLAMFCIYPVIVDNAYFNITITKTNFFLGAGKVFLVAFIVAVFADMIIHETFDIEDKFFIDDSRRFFMKPGFWMELFILANVMAWYMDDCSKQAISGENARYMGLEMYLIIGVVFLCIARISDISKISIVAFAFVTAYTYVVGIVQHLEIDVQYWSTGRQSVFEFMHYRERLSDNQFDIYMSTFGNINIFSSFIVISLCLFLGLFIFTDVLYLKLVAGTVVVLGGTSLMIANSDSGYIGVAGAVFALLLISYNAERIRHFIVSLILLACGNLLVVWLNNYAVREYDKRGGFAQAFDRLDFALVIILALGLLYVLVRYLGTKYNSKLKEANKKKVTGFISVATAVVGLVTIVAGNAMGIGIFTFNDKWGTYRGFVWSRAWNIFCDAPIINKLFGYGNESFGTYMNAYYYEDMKEIVGRLYDNAHNELLQYLITLGIFGVIAYVGLFLSSVIYMLKYGKQNYMVYAFLVATVGYFVQSLINLNQPITTPLYFVIMALGVGYTTYLRKQDGDYDQISSK
ncbi:MAG: O-antigen ligase family protein [Lachnospiraceae bacterium]|nr:O-antigen ligase family protein [Lachnospiraceae bacterium]